MTNIAKILKYCPRGMKLYSPICGDCVLDYVDLAMLYSIRVIKYPNNMRQTFTNEGLIITEQEGAECLLFPSAKMRDWTKFYKRGDLIYDSETNSFAIFNKWVSDDYTAFHVKYQQRNKGWSLDGIVGTINTSLIKPKSESYNGYMKRFEEYFNGKLNTQTLQIESLFKPYDKVLVRDNNHNCWEPDIFALYKKDDTYEYICLRDRWKQCIPYDETRVGTKE